MLISLSVGSVISTAALANVKISGQVNQAAILDSALDDIEVVDNNTTGSRFRFRSSKEFGGFKAGIRYELQAQDNQSSSLSDTGISEVRYSDVWLSGGFGKIAIGKGEGAADGTFESYGLFGHFNGGDLARLTVGGEGVIDGGVNYRSFDGTSRENRIRYDSPDFNGFKFALSVDNGGRNEVGLQYNGKVAGGRLRARAGSVSDEEITSYSIAYRSSFGLGLGYSYGDQDDNRDTDWKTISYTFGKFVAQYGFGEDSLNNEFSVIGINYRPTSGVEIYLNNADASNADGTGGDATYLGSRIRF